MGLLKRIFGIKEHQDISITITSSIADDPVHEKELEPLKRQWEMERNAKIPLYVSDIPYLIPGLDFDKGICYAETFPHYDRDSDDVIQSEPIYYANSYIVDALIPIINEVEGLIEPAYRAVPSLPLLKTRTELIIPIDSPSDMPQTNGDRNMVGIFVHPFTPKGKSARYPVSVIASDQQTFWKHEEGRSFRIANGSNVKLNFLPDGRVGKADIHYWHDKVRHTASFRLSDGLLQLSKLVRLDMRFDSGEQVIYKLR